MTATTDQSTPSGAALPRQHLPDGEEFLMWPPCLQSHGYRIVDQLFATRTIQRGRARAIPRGNEVQIEVPVGDRHLSLGQFMDANNAAGLLVIRGDEVVLEYYGLGLKMEERWSTMSTVKSMTAMLVGAAVGDGAISSLDDPVVRYLPSLEGSVYEGVTVRHLMTMSSGVAWSEDYGDRNSDVNRYSRSLAAKVPDGVLALMRNLQRAEAPGTAWRYNTGDTYLLGALVCAATGRPLAEYMSHRIWRPCGMEFDGFYTLESDNGTEIGGSRAGMALRDIGRFARLVMNDGWCDGSRVLPAGWVEAAATPAFALPDGGAMSAGRRALGLVAYGYSWWLDGSGGMWAMGHCGQRIYVHRAEQLAVVQLAVYPEPRYASAHEPNRDAQLLSLIDQLRRPA
ncbi:serine hydrolase [Hydrogenophaga sp.]|uniref:serine hydrolase domain-containing protein n=1 Tax=Hydrogenophaga sp. TaxID=1904254 RepID=UPI0027317CDE|nr:serine hydrolase [Hydrogenophaga sp.]MDP2073908.1 serine hydrolase [Hydrogenophaga sp.]MDP3107366.1 serine hydrolase [Hydrogenophaga sp.]MDZ4399231.1 serine hydrolase [Hydrogenophaga sp.]